MDFGGLLRSIDQAIAAKNDQQVIDLCNQGIEEFNYSLLLAEKRGNARFNLKLYEEALVDFHNVLEAGINANECRLKIALINNILGPDDKRLLQESIDHIRKIMESDPDQISSLETFFGKELIDFILYEGSLPNRQESSTEIEDSEIKFNEYIYRQYNKDISNLESAALFEHYKKHGIFEGRISSIGVLKNKFKSLKKKLPTDFSVIQYSALNADLRRGIDTQYYGDLKQIKYMEHYINHGTDGRREYVYPKKLKYQFSDPDQFSQHPKNENTVFNDFLGSSRVIGVNKLAFKKPKVSIFILFPIDALRLINLLLSIENQIENRVEVFCYCDNANCSDAIQEICKKSEIKIFDAAQYLNQASGLNSIAKQANGDILLFLDSSLKIEPNLINEISRSFLDNPQLSVLGGKILKDHFSIDSYGAELSSDGETRSLAHDFGKDAFWTNFTQEVDCIPGALFSTKKKIFKELNGFDERLIGINSFCADYCKRAKPVMLDTTRVSFY